MNIKAAVLVLSLLGSCTTPSAEIETLPSPSTTATPVGMVGVPHWEAPDRYEFDLESSCGERSLIGRFHVIVTRGKVHSRGLDERARAFMKYADGHGEEVPSLKELWNEANRARNEGADIVEVLLDPEDGHPTTIEIDYRENAIDDEGCYVITHYAELIDCDGLCISDSTVKVGQQVTVTFSPPKEQIWGVDAQLRPRGKERIAYLSGYLDDDRLRTLWPSPNLGFDAIGFYGRADWTWTVPKRLKPGVYEIAKTSVRIGSAPIEERMKTWTVSFEVAE
jgi:hypothetical protein